MYKGSRQGGISYPKDHPYIFIFSSKSGHKHGYRDQWENDNVFSYTGEGQQGDMDFKAGNLQLLRHAQNGKRIFLFTQAAERSYVKFEDEMEFFEYGYFETPDNNNSSRIGIKFFLKRVGIDLPYAIGDDIEQNILQEDEAKYAVAPPNETERKGLVTSRVGQVHTGKVFYIDGRTSVP